MERRKKILIISLIVLGALALIYGVYFLITYNQQKNKQAAIDELVKPAIEDPLFKKAQEEKNNRVYTFNQGEEDKRLWTAEDLKSVGKNFAERFGSYSNEGNYGNIEDLRLYMSQEMTAWADNYLADLRQKNKYNGAYYGITTTALTAEAKSFDDKIGKATVTVLTNRVEKKDNSPESDYRQSITLDFIKENGQWKVDDAKWLE